MIYVVIIAVGTASIFAVEYEWKRRGLIRSHIGGWSVYDDVMFWIVMFWMVAVFVCFVPLVLTF